MAGSHDYDPGPQIAHAGGLNLGTPDLWRSIPESQWGQTWYGEALDVGPGGAFLSTTPSAGL
ncbi:hypothetical protein ACQP2U_29000 [Nocardia sp. CA-084685]|uniref:hypothetical protein n=1 Tax=Nocardia sp. CA-084685 TaxID=3239970 RepID=UPI003D982CD2